MKIVTLALTCVAGLIAGKVIIYLANKHIEKKAEEDVHRWIEELQNGKEGK